MRVQEEPHVLGEILCPRRNLLVGSTASLEELDLQESCRQKGPCSEQRESPAGSEGRSGRGGGVEVWGVGS